MVEAVLLGAAGPAQLPLHLPDLLLQLGAQIGLVGCFNLIQRFLGSCLGLGQTHTQTSVLNQALSVFVDTNHESCSSDLQEEVDLLQFLLDLLAGPLLRLTAVLLHMALLHLTGLHAAPQVQHLLLQLPLAPLQLVVAAAQALQGGQLLLQVPVDHLQLAAAGRLLLQLHLQITHLVTPERLTLGLQLTARSDQRPELRFRRLDHFIRVTDLVSHPSEGSIALSACVHPQAAHGRGELSCTAVLLPQLLLGSLE